MNNKEIKTYYIYELIKVNQYAEPHKIVAKARKTD